MFFRDGKPMMKVKLVLQTDERDPEDPEDDGVRAVYMQSFGLSALRAGLRAAGLRRAGEVVGGRITVTHTHVGKAEGRRSPPKHFEVHWEPGPAGDFVPEGSEDIDDIPF